MADNNMETRVTEVEKRQAIQDAKFDAFIQEMRDFKTEMRQQNEMRAREIAEMRAKQDADAEAFRKKQDADAAEFRRALTEQQERHDQKMEQLRQDVKEISKEVRALFVAFLGIIIAIMVGIFWSNSSIGSRDTASTPSASRPSVARNAVELPVETAQSGVEP